MLSKTWHRPALIGSARNGNQDLVLSLSTKAKKMLRNMRTRSLFWAKTCRSISWIRTGGRRILSEMYFTYTLKYVPDKDRKAFASDLKTIYHASDEEKARLALDRVTEKWTAKYPNSMKRWYDNWDAITPIFKFSPDVRKVIYTTNAIQSLNSTYRKLNRQRSVFPSDTALLKALYLATFEATKKWTMSIRNWGQVYGERSIMYEGRLPE